MRDLWPQVLIDIKNYKANSFYIKLLFFMEKFLYKYSDLVIVLSEGCKDYVLKNGAKKVEYLPNGPDLNLFKYSPLPNEIGGFSSVRPFKIIYSGAHGLVNGLTNVIDAAKKLDHLPIVFNLIGDGQEKEYLKKYAAGNKSVIFKDPIPKKNIPSYLASADAILISLSKVSLFSYGVSPNKLYDAYALGRPVLTTVPGLINNEVEKYNVGVTANAEDVNSLATSIEKLFYMTRQQREKMSINARKLAESSYSRNLVCEKFYRIINELI